MNKNTRKTPRTPDKKKLNIKSSKDFAQTSPIETFGNPDTWQLLCKASCYLQGWMKSTKAMEIPGVGCLVQVSTQQGKEVAEAITFVPGVQILTQHANNDPQADVVGRCLRMMGPVGVVVGPGKPADLEKRLEEFLQGMQPGVPYNPFEVSESGIKPCCCPPQPVVPPLQGDATMEADGGG